MSNRKLKYLFSVALACMLCACSVTKNIPEGSYVLVKNKIETDRQTPREERVTASEINKFIRQKPVGDFLGSRLWLYSQADTARNGWVDKLFKSIGNAPVLLDTTLTARSVNSIESYIYSRGFFESHETATYKIDTLRRKAKVIYTSYQGRPYRVGDVSYDFRDGFIEKLVLSDDSLSLIRPGDILDLNMLRQERARIAQSLQNMGYYNFNVNNISFAVDTTVGDYVADVKMLVNQYLAGYNDAGEAQLENNIVYRISRIDVLPDYDPMLAATDEDYLRTLDTLEYQGLNIIYHDRSTVRPEVLRRLIKIYPNYIYNDRMVNRTYDDIMRQNYFKSASVLFSVMPEDEDNIVTFVGDDFDETIETKEGNLQCVIRCTPALKQGYSVELEGSTTSTFYGLYTTLGYQNRNLFRGIEQFNVSLTAGYEFLKAKNVRNSFEIGGTASLAIPNFLFPWNIDRLGKTYNPQTRMEFSINSQRRPYYHRVLSTASFGYSWSNGKYTSYSIRPIDISLIKMGYVSNSFLEKLQNPYLRNSYVSQLIAGISGSYLYNDQSRTSSGNSMVVRLNWESVGSLLNLACRTLSNQNHDDGRYKLFGIRYAQYFRADLSFASKLMLGEKAAIAYRLYGGYGFTYGNSRNTLMPFDKLFYAGGVNSMRGWTVRTLGPGNSPVPSDEVYPNQLGNMRLEANLEFRFPVWNVVNGAVFFDLGNIWYAGKGDFTDESVFKFDRFYKQLGFNTGLGLRLDLKVTVLRLDWGVKLHNPDWNEGRRWISKFDFNNTALHFGIGYPF